MFNTLKYAKILEEVGFSREQAETSIGILVEIMEDKLATKQDIADTKQELANAKQELQNSIVDVRHALKELRLDLEHAITKTESKLTIRMGSMFAASIAILTAIQKLT